MTKRPTYEPQRMTTEALWKAIYSQTLHVESMVALCEPWREVTVAIRHLLDLLREADARRRAPQLPWEELADGTGTQLRNS